MDGRARQSDFWTNPEPRTVETAILWTLAYADVFDYPLTADEIHRYLVGTEVSFSAVRDLLDDGRKPERVARSRDYFTLPDREHVVGVRRRRASVAAEIWPKAIRLGRSMACLPFVRMVAVTGALSMDNAVSDDDVDYLIVTEAGRLWLARAMIIQFVVKPAGRRGTEVCPNYVLSERALTQFSHNLFTAHEIVQMVPIAGVETYRRMCRLNGWVARFLPNAYGQPRHVGRDAAARDALSLSTVAETALRSPLGGGLERWEMGRKVRRFERQNRDGDGEASFSPDWCKGHFESHGKYVRAALFERLAGLGAGGAASRGEPQAAERG